MAERISRRLRRLHRTMRRTLQLPTPSLLLLALLAWPALTSLHAQTQPTPAPDKAPPAAPGSLPPPPTPKPPKEAAPQPVPAGAFDPPMTIPPPSPSQSLAISIDPKTPLKKLLPVPPRIKRIDGPAQGNDLTRVPLVRFEAASGVTNAEAIRHIATQIAKINHLNDKKTDGFLEALRNERPDLVGLPFAMGDACRTTGERSRQFALAVATVRQALQVQAPPLPSVPTTQPRAASPPPGLSAPATSFASSGGPPALSSGAAPVSQDLGFTVSLNLTSAATADPPAPETFWEQYQTLCDKEDRALSPAQRKQCDTITLARIAALLQILAPMPGTHPGLVKYLATISHVEATRALARLAIFSEEGAVRQGAIKALKVRRERDYTDILVEGLHYPWPAVARRSTEAIAKLERNDLLPQLIAVLEESDPRAPVMHESKSKRVPVVRELVRVNHHQSCLLCHAPGNTGKVSPDSLSASVPVPGQPLASPSQGYRNASPDNIVRIDVTYLRQDFSAMQPVADANPWPEMQRFDFLVRARELTEEEAATYQEKLTPKEPGRFSPYHRAALAALRELTGRDTEPTPEAWRRLLKLPAQTQHKTKTP